MARVSHHNICRYVDSFVANGNNKFNLVMEYCDGGDLGQYLKRMNGMDGGLNEHKIWRFFLQICLALEAVHSQDIIHGDLKPANLLISGRDYVLKLTDFGSSQKLSQGSDLAHSNTNTLPYCSPELLKNEASNQKTDVWALGCIIYDMVCGKRAFYVANNEEELKQRILSCRTPQLPNNSGLLSSVYSLCMERQLEERPTVAEILSLDFVQEMSRQVNLHLGTRRSKMTLQQLIEAKKGQNTNLSLGFDQNKQKKYQLFQRAFQKRPLFNWQIEPDLQK